MKRIILFLIVIVIVVVAVFNSKGYIKFEHDSYINTYSRNLSNKTIVTNSVTQHIANNASDCRYIAGLLYQDPIFIIRDKVTGHIQEYTITSPKKDRRIVINGGLTSVDQDYTLLFVRYMNTDRECFRSDSWGTIVINGNGDVSNINIPHIESNTNIKVVHNGTEEVLSMYPHYIKSSYSDWNNDGLGDVFLYTPDLKNKEEHRVIIVDEQSWKPNIWFNNGKLLITDENVSKISDDWTKHRNFIRQYSTDKIPTAEELIPNNTEV
ncbi:hypothetical protein A3F59_01905 [Candidatus Roizmanbacteria bacterium RIFCSPHIGHO2_12_FULL_38_13]|nr:MAG: hypothetical protein A2905_03925 [Candidatus Levybacteria bacterium RIFCSPLOWO2_01_FULL_36_10]OGK35676.1 MAG: hypothetical protein A3F59_01905 [Candidatus Roizmanbacteria bacterium RIFCSPHIGHO2_12_FULL_38_13]